MYFVFFFEASQDCHGILYTRFANQDSLKPSFQGGVLFQVSSIFIQSCSADTVQLATRERGLEHVAGIHSAFSTSGTHHGM